jgi:multiple sugar transport system ATP-binding protein
VTFSVAEGEFMVLLGPSGCGKSTTLRMVAGLESITGGEVSIDDRVVNDVPAMDRDIAMVFQSYALYPHMTVAENLAFGLKRRKLPAAQIAERVNRVAHTLGLTELLRRKPFALSGGQRQRVALGRAIVREPKVFLFDEPLSNLDAALRVNTRNELVRLHHRLGATMLYVTHDQVEAMTMGQRICVLNRGRLAQIGKPLEVYRQPADAFVARFLGSPPMNLLKARIVTRDDQCFAECGSATLALRRWRAADLVGGDGSVLVGVRPEEMSVVEAAPPEVNVLRGKVSALEPLGAETLLIVDLEGAAGEVTARVHRDIQLPLDASVSLAFASRALYLFDGRTEKAIPASAS